MKNKKDIRDSHQVTLATWICIFCGALLFAAYTVLSAASDLPGELIGVICLLIYLACATSVFLANQSYRSKKRLRSG